MMADVNTTITPKRKPTKVDCPLCDKELSSNNYHKHLRHCNLKLQGYLDYKSLDAGYNAYDITNNKTLYHVMFRLDTCTNVDEFMSYWTVYNNIYAKCGSHGVVDLEYDQVCDHNLTKNPHVHFVGSYNNPSINHRSDVLKKLFTSPKSYRCLDLTSASDNLLETDHSLEANHTRREAHFRLLKVIWYIQTVKGTHYKYDHKNKVVFKNKYEKNKFIKDHATNNMWSTKLYFDFICQQLARYKYMQDNGISIKNKSIIAHIDEKYNHLLTTYPGICTVTDEQLLKSYDLYLEYTICYKDV